jgi:hypothetical protein
MNRRSTLAAGVAGEIRAGRRHLGALPTLYHRFQRLQRCLLEMATTYLCDRRGNHVGWFDVTAEMAEAIK